MPDGHAELTDWEKATLRLIVRGHDAKSIARHFGLSVHTINERLRAARRKLGVTSSREAARKLFEIEGGAPDLVGYDGLGEAAPAPVMGSDQRPNRIVRFAPVAGGIALMSVALAMLVFAASPPLPVDRVATAPIVSAAVTDAADPAVEAAAREWLAMLDRNDWEASYRATGAQFRQLNTLQVWTNVSEQVRARFGALRPGTRTLVSQELVPAPPAGYWIVKFRASYANQADTLETLSLAREGDAWRVVGITLE